MDKRYWIDVLEKWLIPFEQNNEMPHSPNGSKIFFGGREEVNCATPEGTKRVMSFRSIDVFVGGLDIDNFNKRDRHERANTIVFCKDCLQKFNGKFLAIEEGHLVLLYDKHTPTFIPWEDIRYIKIR